MPVIAAVDGYALGGGAELVGEPIAKEVLLSGRVLDAAARHRHRDRGSATGGLLDDAHRAGAPGADLALTAAPG